MTNNSIPHGSVRETIGFYDESLRCYRYKKVKKYANHFGVNSRLLDCACGPGHGSKFFENCISYTGVDISEEAINDAQKNYGEYGVFHLSDGVNLPFPDETFEIVSSLETIEHLSQKDHYHFISELLRVLKPSGKIIITTPNRNYIYKTYLKRKGWHNPYHQYEYEPKEFLKFIKSFSNLTVNKAYTMGFPIPLPVRLLRLHKLPRHVLEFIASAWISLGVCCFSWSNSIILIAEKK